WVKLTVLIVLKIFYLLNLASRQKGKTNKFCHSFYKYTILVQKLPTYSKKNWEFLGFRWQPNAIKLIKQNPP
ncbi:hypothetical protein, partial [Bacillus pseudomycoides]|uniref:hypothetical protein n=1 Tax=Bacillus pseudomycoides TaxID=64104 RepID=UPI001C92D069